MGFRRRLVRIRSPRHDGGVEVTRSYGNPSNFSLRRKSRRVSFRDRNPRPSLTKTEEEHARKRAEGRLADANPTKPYPRRVHLGKNTLLLEVASMPRLPKPFRWRDGWYTDAGGKR